MNPEHFAPPRLAVRLLKLLTRGEDWIFLAGDADEEFEWRAGRHGRARARLWYWGHLLKSIPSSISESFFWRLVMLKNYMTIAWRNILRHKGHSFIKISGLALGISCCLLALLHVRSELSYDRFHPRADSIFRVIRVGFNNQDYRIRYKDPSLQPTLGSYLQPSFPEIERQTRYADFLTGVVNPGSSPFQEVLAMADPDFFRMFGFRLTAGNAESVLSSLNSIVLTESSARKYYGRGESPGENPDDHGRGSAEGFRRHRHRLRSAEKFDIRVSVHHSHRKPSALYEKAEFF